MSHLQLELDRHGEEPLYQQLIRQIQLQIDSGDLPAGSRLPATRELAETLAVSRVSVVTAYADLRSRGYLSTQAGRGTFVSRDVDPIAPITDVSEFAIPQTAPRSTPDELRQLANADAINFAQGALSEEFFPTDHLREALNHVLDRDGAAALSYEAPEGYPPLRKAIAAYVRNFDITCDDGHVLITGGAQQALDLAVQSLTNASDWIITSNPTYTGILDIARARRLRVFGVPLDEQGMQLDLLEEAVQRLNPRLIYVMPTFQNPTGQVMTLPGRRRLLRLAKQHGIPLLEDSVYHEFRYEGESLPPLRALDDGETVIHVSAFTKMLLPGMRIGYIIAGGERYQRLVRVKHAADISTSPLSQRALHHMMQRGVLAAQLRRNTELLQVRRDAALEAARTEFPDSFCWNYPQGGLYLWVQLPQDGPTAAELADTATQQGVTYADGSLFSLDHSGAYHLRINYGIQSPARIREGFRRITDAWMQVTSKI